jgi:hypothetical protein
MKSPRVSTAAFNLYSHCEDDFYFLRPGAILLFVLSYYTKIST